MVSVSSMPWMTENEVRLFARWIPLGCIALEFGSGGSTRFFFENGGGSLASVEGDAVWVQSLLEDAFLNFFIKKRRLKIFQPDIGPVRQNACSLPAGKATPLWLNYHAGIWNKIDSEALTFILIDGRFRCACALQSIIHCKQKPILLMHDFWNRPQYHPILEFTDVLDRVDSLVVLRQKDVVDLTRVAFCLKCVQFDPL